jgi:hypothetical protein
MDGFTARPGQHFQMVCADSQSKTQLQKNKKGKEQSPFPFVLHVASEPQKRSGWA